MFAGEKEFAHGVTYAGHPVAAAVALENVRIIEEEGLATRAAGPIGAYFAGAPGEPRRPPARGRGADAGLDRLGRAGRRTRCSHELFEPEGRVGVICRDACVRNGLVMRAIRDGMVLAPPLVVTESQIDEIVTKARASLDETARAIGRA